MKLQVMSAVVIVCESLFGYCCMLFCSLVVLTYGSYKLCCLFPRVRMVSGIPNPESVRRRRKRSNDLVSDKCVE